MKIIVIVFALFSVVLASCTQTYSCGRQCYIFNGTIKICQGATVTADGKISFAKTVDSLTHLYGAGTSVFADSVTVTGNSENAVNTITLELEQQGYTCNLQ